MAKIHTWPTLYKLNSRGKRQVWNIWVEEAGKNYKYVVQYGQQDGEMVEAGTIVSAGKNIGKANETSVKEQCISEAKSKWTKQKDKGYAETTDKKALASAATYLPMLAHNYEDYSHHLVLPCYGQPKLDGIRCIAIHNTEGVQLLSRKGKLITSVPHINTQVALAMDDNVALDGELYIHGKAFQKLTSSIRKDDPTPESALVEYHIYDCFSIIEDWTNIERQDWLRDLKNDVGPSIKFVDTIELSSAKDIQEYHDKMVAEGYEGVMLRNIDGVYEINKRSKNLLKLKSFMTEEFEIVGAEENKGRAAGQCSLLCITKDGTQFAVKPEGTDAEREQYWKDKDSLIGKMLTVRFFEYTTSDCPVPRFPVGISIRNYE
jgi:DNA ligase-1